MLNEKQTKNFWAKVDLRTTDECWIWKGCDGAKGYGLFRVDKKMYQVHRLVWIIFNGPIPDGMCVCHKCDTPLCVNPNHLFLGTPLDNSTDMVTKSRSARQFGEAHGAVKLSEQDIYEILDLRKEGLTYKSISSMFGVSESLVGLICRGRRWSFLNLVKKND